MQTIHDVEFQAHEAWERGDLQRAFYCFLAGAELDLPGCMTNLGYFYDAGLAIRADKSKAMYWYKRAYRLGSASAAANLAMLHRERRRFRLMCRCLYLSAALGDGDAQLDLGKCYLTGQGVSKSRRMARRCFLQALKSDQITPAGRADAQKLLHRMR
ncbi:tetratricopeptide repeat protein [Undibacterium sp. RuTC16W]|uniref:tetratricopeptide repeat protein n=1 Tax=Undibacterium sp. RuTC16W TaxID=3413048 RepID=UPI003BF37E8B